MPARIGIILWKDQWEKLLEALDLLGMYPEIQEAIRREVMGRSKPLKEQGVTESDQSSGRKASDG